MDDEPQRRTRRSPEEIDDLILESARALFAAGGYHATTTREVAKRAGVHEPMVYRRFASKAKLFEASVLVPFNEVVSSYLATWEAQADNPTELESLVRAYIEPLHGLLLEHRELALALVAGNGAERGPDDDGEEPDPFSILIDRMNPQLEMEADRRALRVDGQATVVVTLGMVLGVALLEGVLRARTEPALTPQRLREEMVSYTLRGVSPAAGSADAGPDSELARELLERLIACERRATQAEFELRQLLSG